MQKLITCFFALTLTCSALGATLQKITYSKASGYTGLKKSLIYQAIGTKRYRRLV